MASAAPSVLPVTIDTTQPPTVTTAVSAVESQPAIRAFINRISHLALYGFSHRRSWSELLDRAAFARPESLSEAAIRFWKNYAYFRVNYLFVMVLIVGFSLLAHPFSLLLLICLLASWLLLFMFRPADVPLVLFGRSFSDCEILGVLLLYSIVLIFFTSVGSVLISSLMVGLAVVCAHGAFRVPDDLFLEEQDPTTIGFLSFLRGAAASAAPTVAQSS